MKVIIQFTSIESFSTKRLIVKKINANDLNKFVEMHTNAAVMATLGGLRNADRSKQDLERHLNRWQEEGFGSWLFYLKNTNEWIGRAGLRRLIVAGNEEVEIGYALLPQFWRQGFATEMAAAVAEIAFEVIRLKNVVCFTEKTNIASLRVMKKIGFQYERDFIYEGIPHILCRLKTPYKAEVIPYNPAWPEIFETESRKIKQALGGHLRKIYHIGSTAIPNMPAKPVIDILLVCENLDAIDDINKKLSDLSYCNIRPNVIPHRMFFVRKQEEQISFHLHICERGDPQINRHVNFKDYVITHPDDGKRYADLKINLAKQFSDDMPSYVLGKDNIVQEIDTKAKLWPQRKMDYLPPNTGPCAKSWMKEKIIKAMEANLNVHMTHFAQYLNQIALIRMPEFTILNSGLPDDTFNYVLRAGFSSADANKKINEATKYFREKNIPFSWWISPYDKPENLSHYLENNGYVNTENNCAMYFDLDTWDGNIAKHPHLEIIQAKDKKALQDFALVLANDTAAFKKYFEWIASVLTDEDPIEYYVGYVEGIPVVRGLSCYFAQVAGLHWLSTAPNERKKGYGKAMQEYRLKHAKELGYHIAVLQASHDGYPLYKKLGYKECGTFSEFKLLGK